MKKTTKLGKNKPQTSGFAVMKKAPTIWKNIKKKKNHPAYLCGYDLQNGVQNFFLNKWFLRYLSFGDFKVPKNCSSQ